MKYVCNQTEIKTIFCTKTYIASIAKLKQDDSSSAVPRLHRIEALVCYDEDIDQSAIESCKSINIKVYKYSEIIQKGIEIIESGKLEEKLP
jgi:hypothetical protein